MRPDGGPLRVHSASSPLLAILTSTVNPIRTLTARAAVTSSATVIAVMPATRCGGVQPPTRDPQQICLRSASERVAICAWAERPEAAITGDRTCPITALSEAMVMVGDAAAVPAPAAEITADDGQAKDAPPGNHLFGSADIASEGSHAAIKPPNPTAARGRSRATGSLLRCSRRAGSLGLGSTGPGTNSPGMPCRSCRPGCIRATCSSSRRGAASRCGRLQRSLTNSTATPACDRSWR